MPSPLSLAAAVIAVILFLAHHANSHGFVDEITLGETKYGGFNPWSDEYVDPIPQRIVRKIPGNGGVFNVSHIDIQCNGYGEVGTKPAPLFGLIAAGDTVTFNWTTWPQGHKGPMITYMARAPDDVPVTKWMPGLDSVWFKVHESGRDENGLWAAPDRLMANNRLHDVKIPRNLRPGQYLIRHEIIALHEAQKYLGAQFYVSCIQVEVTGNGNAFPTDFVSFPGAYTGETPGVVFDLKANTGPYPIPGPAVWTGGD